MFVSQFYLFFLQSSGVIHPCPLSPKECLAGEALHRSR
jgi:hypothetical protein